MLVDEKLTVILDFDHTLFDAKHFLELAAEVSKRFQVPRTEFYRTYRAVTDGLGDTPYTFNSHVRAMPGLSLQQQSKLRMALEGSLQQCRRCLYSDSKRFIKRLKKWNVELLLVTYADKHMRTRQLRSVGLDDAFDGVYILSQNRKAKIDCIKSIVSKSYRSVLIDDHPSILKSFLRSECLSLRVQRIVHRCYKDIEPKLPGVPVFRDLDAAHGFLLPVLKSFSSG